MNGVERTSAEAARKYREWAGELASRRDSLRRSRKNLVALLVAAALTAVPAWMFASRDWALADITFWVVLYVTGFYISTMYDWDYQRQIEFAENEIGRLESGGAPGVEAGTAAAAAAAQQAANADRFAPQRIQRKLTWGFRDRIS